MMIIMDAYLCGEHIVSKEKYPELTIPFHFMNGNHFYIGPSNLELCRNPYNITRGIYFYYLSRSNYCRTRYLSFLKECNKTIRDIFKKI